MLLLEIVLVVILVSLLFLVAVEQLLPLRGQAEGAAVQGSIGAMQASIGTELADRALHGGSDALVALEHANPIDFLATPPGGYVGARPTVDPVTLAPGQWAFDQSRGVLLYRVRHPQYFSGSLMDPPRGEWRIELAFRGEQRSPGQLRSVLLVPLADMNWQPATAP